MHNYIRTLESVALSIEDVKDAELEQAFVWGLKDQVHQEVRLHDPKTLEDAARLAFEFDE